MTTYFVTFRFANNMNKRVVAINELNFEKAFREAMRIKYFEEEIVSIIKEEF